jgi:transcription antitermination factor NusG
MFIHVDLSRVGLSAINWMPYASGLVSFDGEPASIKEDMLWSLHRSIEEYKRTQAGAYGQFRHGERLTVTAGAFAGYEAIFDTRLSSSNRIRIFLQLARGKQVSVELPALHVQRQTQESTFPQNRAV